MRIPAKRIPISKLKEGTFVEAKGQWDSNYVVTKDDESVSRILLYGIIISKYLNVAKEFCSITLDDLTDDIRISGFKGMAKTLQVFEKGDTILVVGRIKKDLKDSIYIFPEVVKKVEPEMYLLNVFENY
ncbi:nucleic acid binding OB-fold tRNA/helicase-type [Methanococcus vannielii SB]|uniref:Nucleic acid binding OB-fold tRNA/helicase-type n=1 Tax=Methanococcus vannielii (strain ATCC 35089 / DSM 1224 / JCM 13029 / OCM 148 / SB) TaxID=406327 RepID=A6URA3_METVS|nr:OB-fold nucleic acid binding domain-containing protein [Methanococcus vannielii]ABR55025.1 nucleic acid binding OB-fold tRNA/helicase-type [Methanococcus vannielii SB]